MTQFEKITSETLSVPTVERAELAEILIQSLDEKEDEDIRTAWLQEIRQRDRKIRSGKAVLKPVDQVLREAREQLRCTE